MAGEGLRWYTNPDTGKTGLLWWTPTTRGTTGSGLAYSDADCECCPGNCPCDCAELQSKLLQTTSGMKVRIQVPCVGYDEEEALSQDGEIPDICASLATTVIDGLANFPTDLKFHIGCKGSEIKALFTWGDAANCVPDNDDMTVITNTCDPLAIVIEFGIVGGGAPGDPCSFCTGDTITVTLIP